MPSFRKRLLISDYIIIFPNAGSDPQGAIKMGSNASRINNFRQKLQKKKFDRLLERGRNYGDEGKFIAALNCFDKAIKIIQGSAEAWYWKGKAHAANREIEAAIISLDMSLKLDPTRDNVWIEKGSLLGNLGRYEEAIAAFMKVIEMDPKDDPKHKNLRAMAYSNIGFVHELKKDIARAEEFYKKAIKAYPFHLESYAKLYILLKAQDRLEEAEKWKKERVMFSG